MLAYLLNRTNGELCEYFYGKWPKMIPKYRENEKGDIQILMEMEDLTLYDTTIHVKIAFLVANRGRNCARNTLKQGLSDKREVFQKFSRHTNKWPRTNCHHLFITTKITRRQLNIYQATLDSRVLCSFKSLQP